MRHAPTTQFAVLLVLLVPLLVDTAAAQGSDDCLNRPTAADRAICQTEALGRLDTQLAALYRTLRSRLDTKAQQTLTQDQDAWVALRNECGARTTCITTRYGERILVLQRRVDSVRPDLPVLASPSTTARTEEPQACQGERDITSLNSRIPTTITFRNESPSQSVRLHIYWLDYKGRRQHRATLARGQSHTQRTYLTHPWLVTRATREKREDCLRILMPDPGGRSVSLK